jgi:hypothetical protein
MRRGYGGGFRDELVTQSLTTGTIVAASAFDEVTEFGYFEYCGRLRVKQTSLVLCAWDTEARRSLRNGDDFHLLITSGNGARAMGSTKHVKCTAHQIE